MTCRNGGGIYYDNSDDLDGISGCFFGLDSDYSRVIYDNNKALGKNLFADSTSFVEGQFTDLCFCAQALAEQFTRIVIGFNQIVILPSQKHFS